MDDTINAALKDCSSNPKTDDLQHQHSYSEPEKDRVPFEKGVLAAIQNMELRLKYLEYRARGQWRLG